MFRWCKPVCICVHIWRPEDNVRGLPLSLYTVCFKTWSVKPPHGCFGQSGWPVSSRIQLSLSSQNKNYRHTLPCLASMWVLVVQTQVLRFVVSSLSTESLSSALTSVILLLVIKRHSPSWKKFDQLESVLIQRLHVLEAIKGSLPSPRWSLGQGQGSHYLGMGHVWVGSAFCQAFQDLQAQERLSQENVLEQQDWGRCVSMLPRDSRFL